MGAAITAGVFGLVGALIGGVVTFSVNWLNLRSQQSEAGFRQQERILDRQYEAHVTFLTRLNRLIDQARVSGEALATPSTPQNRMNELHLTYFESWQGYYETTASVQLAGPAELSGVVRDLQTAVMKYSMQLIDWHENNPASRTHAEWLGILRPLAKEALAQRTRYIDCSVSVFSPSRSIRPESRR